MLGQGRDRRYEPSDDAKENRRRVVLHHSQYGGRRLFALQAESTGHGYIDLTVFLCGADAKADEEICSVLWIL